jgi:hypothetical protein
MALGALSRGFSMAKRDEQKAKSTGNGQNTVQGFVFGINLKGTESVVMEGIKAFTQAMEKSGVTLGPPVIRPALASGPQRQNGAAVIDQEPEQIVDELAEEESTTVEPEEDIEATASTTERKRRIPPDPKVVNDLDITAGPTPLKTFVEQKGPRKTQDRLVVVATWLKKHKNYEEITRDHLYTCYQQLGGGSGDWKAPNDFDTYMRTLANRKSWFEPGTGPASFKVTIIATNYVDGMTASA